MDIYRVAMRKFLCFLSSVCLAFVSCEAYDDTTNNDSDGPAPNEITILPTSLKFGAEGGEKRVTIIANVDYEFICDADWVEYEPVQYGVVIAVEAHTSKTKRTAQLEIVNAEFDIKKLVTIEQSAYVSNYTSSVSIEKAEIAWDEMLVKGMTSGDPNYTYSIKITKGGDFCNVASASGKVGSEFMLNFTKNMSETERVAEVSVVFSDGFSKSFAIKQMGKEPETIEDSYYRQWAEQPEHNNNPHYIHKTYYSVLSDYRRVRNFSVCYDTIKMCSRWVAYPAHSIYRTGKKYQVGENNNSGRTNAWAFDDAVTKYAPSTDYNAAYEIVSKYVASKDAYDTSKEPIIPHRRQADICYSNAFEWGWARGHMLPSANRYNSWENNAQTCYATNIMVQQYDFNSGGWADVENFERSKLCSDTLFVVVGTLFEDSQTINRFGRTIGVPTHCYKLLLRTKSGSTRKAISEITSASELICIGFLYENRESSANTAVSAAAVSVAEVEKRAGFKFFRNINPAIADAVKSQKQLSDWGL